MPASRRWSVSTAERSVGVTLVRFERLSRGTPIGAGRTPVRWATSPARQAGPGGRHTWACTSERRRPRCDGAAGCRRARRCGGARSVAVRLLSGALAVSAVGIGAALLGSGASLPSIGPVLLLASIAALCINRSVFYLSEQAATAEAAVLLAAVTAFEGSAPWLGPLVVALLMGPLDVAHWERRSYLRMAYNAGNRSFCALSATATFLVVHEAAAHLGGSLRLRGRPDRGAAGCVRVRRRRRGPVVHPAGGAGRRVARRSGTHAARRPPDRAAGAGGCDRRLPRDDGRMVGPRSGTGPGGVRARAGHRARGAVPGDHSAGGLGRRRRDRRCTVARAAAPGCRPRVRGVALVVVAVLVGFEFEVDVRVAVPPLFAMLVVAALVVIRGEGAWASAVVAVVAGTVVSWSLAPVRTVRRVVVASSLAVGATALAVGASELVGSVTTCPRRSARRRCSRWWWRRSAPGDVPVSSRSGGACRSLR